MRWPRRISPDSLLAGPDRGTAHLYQSGVKARPHYESITADPRAFVLRRRVAEMLRQLNRDIPQKRHMLVAARGLHDVAASGEGEVIAGDQRAVGGDAIEQPLACLNRVRTVDVELRLPLRMAREQRRMLRGVA